MRARTRSTGLVSSLVRRCAIAGVLFGLGILPGAWHFVETTRSQAAPSDHLWSQRFGDLRYQEARSVAVDDTNNVLIAGVFSGTVNFGGASLTSDGTELDIFLAKFDSLGNHLWSKRFGDSLRQEAAAVGVDSTGNVFLTGDMRGSVDFGGGPVTSTGDQDVFVAKFDGLGNQQWSRQFGEPGTTLDARSLAVDSQGDVTFTGNFNTAIDFGGGVLTGAGDQDMFVVKLSGAGRHIWSRSFGDSVAQYAQSIAVDVSGNIILTGYFLGALNVGGDTLVASSSNEFDVFVAKFGSDGDHIWSQRFGDAQGQYPSGVATDSAGAVLLVGWFAGAVDFGGGPLLAQLGEDVFVAKFDSAGSHLWSKRFGDESDQRSGAVTADPFGNVLVTGWFDGTIDFGGGPLMNSGGAGGGQDIFVVAFDSDGNHGWSKRFGDTSFQHGRSIASDRAGNVHLAGEFSGAIDFGGGLLSSAGGNDAFLAKLSGVPCPDLDCDGVMDAADNCPSIANADQLNSDRNYYDNSPPFVSAVDDKTQPNSDAAGDACDPDDDNDGLTDLVEGLPSPCVSATGTTDAALFDTDGDRFGDGTECAAGSDPTDLASKPAFSVCGSTTDSDGDRISDRVETCFYNTDPNNNDTDGDRTTNGATDGCEATSFNQDRVVNIADQGMLASAITGINSGNPSWYLVNLDVNKDGALNIADVGLVASFRSPSGQCPG